MGGMIGTMRGDRMLRAGRNQAISGFGFEFDPTEIVDHGAQRKALTFRPDGTRYYCFDDSSSGKKYIRQYDLAVPWLPSSFVASEPYRLTTGLSPAGCVFKPDGTSFFVFEGYDRRVVEYTLSVPWDVTTAVFLRQSGAIFSGYYGGIEITPDGRSLFVLNSNVVGHFTMATPWDPSTLVYDQSKTFAPITEMKDISFAANGMGAMVAGRPTNAGNNNFGIALFTMDDPWDFASLTYSGRQIHMVELVSATSGPGSVYYRDERDHQQLFFVTNGRYFSRIIL
ncbi:hypothetical protein MACH17_11520 [Phaeobacter inhibens]|uniref:hypothetical protein n=1 Tax=Phaeobacter inhibens TaxID=221822 RepID=UPI002748E690|nr:hypothetical protein [Phaeobacter inhibens]GLO69635.1 hypothetical protein MACH17_11520 [Phaeobacter inhibens]